MTKTVFSNAMVAHVWAQQTQDEGRSNNGNFYFSGRTIYSYGSHFPIATFTVARGRQCVLFTTRGYSKTTNGKHIPAVRRALPSGVPVFYVENVNEGLSYCIADYARRFEAPIKDAAKARTRKARLMEQANHVEAEAIRFAEFFGCPRPNLIEVSAELRAATEREIALNAARVAERDAVRAAAQAEAEAAWPAILDLWREHRTMSEEQDAIWYEWYGVLPIGLRRKLCDVPTIETTRGAEFPLNQALAALPVIERCKSKGVEWKRNGHRVPLGHFQIDRISSDGDVVAGCHTVPYAEIMTAAARVQSLIACGAIALS